jgi:hypothetical protein
MTDTPTLLHSTAHIQTPNAARYLTQLCKHLSHRTQVTLGEGVGDIVFEAGAAHLAADAGVLRITADAPDPDALARVQDVVARHLVRFAFREDLVVDWS